jgi:holo-ACP synthase
MARIKLEELLFAREDRSRRIRSFLFRYRLPIVVLTLNIPGPDKTPEWADQVFSAGVNAAREAFSPQHEKSCLLPSGFEWYGVVKGDPLTLKKKAIRIEEAHPLGRLFDIDLHAPDSPQLDRAALRLGPRRCLICSRPAHECGRSRRHGLEELLLKAGSLADRYVLEQDYTLQKQ